MDHRLIKLILFGNSWC